MNKSLSNKDKLKITTILDLKLMSYVWILTFLTQFITRILLFELLNIELGIVMLIIQPIISFLIGIIAFFKFNKSLRNQPKIKFMAAVRYYIKSYLFGLIYLFIGEFIWIQNIHNKIIGFFSYNVIASFMGNKFLYIIMENAVMSIILEFIIFYYFLSYLSYTIMKCRYSNFKV